MLKKSMLQSVCCGLARQHLGNMSVDDIANIIVNYCSNAFYKENCCDVHQKTYESSSSSSSQVAESKSQVSIMRCNFKSIAINNHLLLSHYRSLIIFKPFVSSILKQNGTNCEATMKVRPIVLQCDDKEFLNNNFYLQCGIIQVPKNELSGEKYNQNHYNVYSRIQNAFNKSNSNLTKMQAFDYNYCSLNRIMFVKEDKIFDSFNTYFLTCNKNDGVYFGKNWEYKKFKLHYDGSKDNYRRSGRFRNFWKPQAAFNYTVHIGKGKEKEKEKQMGTGKGKDKGKGNKGKEMKEEMEKEKADDCGKVKDKYYLRFEQDDKPLSSRLKIKSNEFRNNRIELDFDNHDYLFAIGSVTCTCDISCRGFTFAVSIS